MSLSYWRLLPALAASAVVAASPPVITLQPFTTSGNDFNYVTAYMVPLREHAAASLVARYECEVLSRSHGHLQSREADIGSLAATSGQHKAAFLTPAADLMIHGIVDYVMVGGRSNQDVCFVVINDLHSATGRCDTVIPLTVPTFADFGSLADHVADGIARQLHLSPRPADTLQAPVANEGLWAVFPVIRYGGPHSATEDVALATVVEAAIQDAAPNRRLVDHRRMDDLLREWKIAAMEDSTDGTSARAARLLGADTAVITTVSPGPKPRLHASVLVLDLRTHSVRDGRKTVVSEEDLATTLSHMASQFARSARPARVLAPASREQLSRERLSAQYVVELIQKNSAKPYPISERYLSTALETHYYITRSMGLADLHGPAARMLFNSLVDFRDRSPAAAQIGEMLADLCDGTIPDVTEAEMAFFRARAFHARQRYAEALHQMSLPAMASYRDTQLGIALRTDTLAELGRVSEARRILDGLPAIRGSEIATALKWAGAWKDEEWEYRTLRRIDPNDLHPHPDVFRRYLKLMQVRNDIDLLRRFLDGLRDIHAYGPEGQLDLADAYLAVGQPEKARRLFVDREDALAAGQPWLTRGTPELKARVNRRAAELWKRVAAVQVDLIPLAERWQVPEGHYVCVVPFAPLSPFYLGDALAVCRQQVGPRVRIAPAIPLPRDAETLNSERQQYHKCIIYQRVRSLPPPPADCAAVAFLTDQPLYCEEISLPGLWMTSEAEVSLVTMNDIHSSLGPVGDVAGLLLSRACFRGCTPVYTCKAKRCLMNSMHPQHVAGSKGRVCPECMAIAAASSGKVRDRRFLWDGGPASPFQSAYASSLDRAWAWTNAPTTAAEFVDPFGAGSGFGKPRGGWQTVVTANAADGFRLDPDNAGLAPPPGPWAVAIASAVSLGPQQGFVLEAKVDHRKGGVGAGLVFGYSSPTNLIEFQLLDGRTKPGGPGKDVRLRWVSAAGAVDHFLVSDLPDIAAGFHTLGVRYSATDNSIALSVKDPQGRPYFDRTVPVVIEPGTRFGVSAWSSAASRIRDFSVRTTP